MLPGFPFHPALFHLLKGVAVAFGCVVSFAANADTTRLQSLLDNTPQGGWVQVNTTSFSSAWPTGGVAVPGTSGSPRLIVSAWSSVAWDSTNDQLLLWGGGHANYAGNEMYTWSAATGAWSLGSLPSRLNQADYGIFYVVDNAAPQAAHTYDNNLYLPVNRMFMTFGGAAYNTGANFATANCVAGSPFAACTNVARAGPWFWDPAKADSTKVGGTTGSGYSAITQGGNMWLNRAAFISGAQGDSYLQAATANRVEMINGKPTDVVYITSDSQASGFPGLYRYEVGDAQGGSGDLMQKIGVTSNSVVYQGTATIDLANNLFIRTAHSGSASATDLAVWNLANSNINQPSLNQDIAVRLMLADGSDFAIGPSFGMDYDAKTGHLLLWEGASDLKVWQTDAMIDGSGNVLSTWIVTPVLSTTSAGPAGNFYAGVLGKWHYVDELSAFIALDEYNLSTADAGVWLYKPFDPAAAVPEGSTVSLMLVGLLVVGLRLGRVTRLSLH